MSKASEFAMQRQRPGMYLPESMLTVSVSDGGHLILTRSSGDQTVVLMAEVPDLIEWLRETYE